MSLVRLLIVIVCAIVLGGIVALVVCRLLIRIKKKKIVENAYGKILKQDQKFRLDGKEYNLKAEVKKGMEGKEPEIGKGSDDIKQIKKIRKETAEIIKQKKKLEKSMEKNEKKIKLKKSEKKKDGKTTRKN